MCWKNNSNENDTESSIVERSILKISHVLLKAWNSSKMTPIHESRSTIQSASKSCRRGGDALFNCCEVSFGCRCPIGFQQWTGPSLHQLESIRGIHVLSIEEILRNPEVGFLRSGISIFEPWKLYVNGSIFFLWRRSKRALRKVIWQFVVLSWFVYDRFRWEIHQASGEITLVDGKMFISKN